MSKVRQRRPRNTGTVRKRGNNFQFLFRQDGTQYSRTVAAESLTAAKAMLPAFVDEVMSGRLGAARAEEAKRSKAPTFGEWADNYPRDYMRVDEDGQASVDAYKAVFAHLTPELRACLLPNLTEDMLRSWLRQQHVSGRAKPRADGSVNLSIATIKLYRAAVSVCLSKAVKPAKLIPANPTPKFSDLNLGPSNSLADNAKRSVLTQEQISDLFTVTGNEEVDLWIAIMGSANARPGEALAPRWRNVDFDKSILHIDASVKRTKRRGHGRLGATKTKSSVRSIPIGPTLLAMLAKARDRQEGLLRKLAGLAEGVTPVRPLVEPDMCIFYADISTPEGLRAPRSLSGMRHRFRAAAKKAGLPARATPHSLRHTAITAMLAGDGHRPGISIADAAALAGHSSPSTTAEVYAHAIAANMRQGSQLSDGLIRAPHTKPKAVK